MPEILRFTPQNDIVTQSLMEEGYEVARKEWSDWSNTSGWTDILKNIL